MERRQFLSASFSASALALAREGFAETAPQEPREYDQIRLYTNLDGIVPSTIRDG